METNKTSLDDKIALIHSDLQKIIKHFKLDRRSKSNPDDPAGYLDATEEESNKLLREILERISEISDHKDFTAEQTEALKRIESVVDKALQDFHNTEYRKLSDSLEKIWQALNDLKAEKQGNIVEHHHRHTIDIGSSKLFISMIVMVLMILGLSYVVGNQRRIISQFRDNDIKYRYVKMHSGATAGDIETLERIFTYHRNADSVRLIRRQVEQYERLVKETAEKIEQARLNASEAERLQNQAETVKKGK